MYYIKRELEDLDWKLNNNYNEPDVCKSNYYCSKIINTKFDGESHEVE